MTENLPEDIQKLPYEQARDELMTIVAKLESGEAPLDESMKLWERGDQLAKRCQECLDGVKQKLEKDQ